MKPLKAYVNLLLYKLNRAFRRTVLNNYPVVAFVDPTTFCNLECPACPTGIGAGLRTVASMNWDLYRAFMDEVGDYLFKLYLYNLGEPLLHKKTPEMVAYAKKKEICVLISTNFSRNYPAGYMERLVESGLDVLVVALDGTTEETYGKYRRGGDFQLVKKNMRRIGEIKRELNSTTPRVVWQFLAFGHNEQQIAEVKTCYRDWGADDYWIGGGFLPAASLRDEMAPSSIVPFNLYDPRSFASTHTMKILAENHPCSWLHGSVVLSPNGMVSPCCYTPAEKDDFGMYDASAGFMKIWNGPAYVRARELFASAAPLPDADGLGTLMRRVDGRGLEATRSLHEGELICERCPVPYLQDLVEKEIEWDDREIVCHLQAQTSLTPEESELLNAFVKLVGAHP